MRAQFFVRQATGSQSEVFQVSDGTFFTDNMGANEGNFCQFYPAFFSDAAGTTLVTPTAGTIAPRCSPGDGIWLEPGNAGVLGQNATINAVDVKPDATYNVPEFEGKIVQGKVTLSGITGAPYARMIFWRY